MIHKPNILNDHRTIDRLARLAGVLALLGGASVLAATQEEVFKSISQNVRGKPTDITQFLAIMLGGVAILILLVVLANRRMHQGGITPRLNHPQKLMREVAAGVGLHKSQVKQLQTLQTQLKEHHGVPVNHALTLLLCPSLIARKTPAGETKDQ
jgi:hypothetical protein